MVRMLNLSAIFFFLAVSEPARADHFTIDLEVKAPKANKTVHAETLGLGPKPGDPPPPPREFDKDAILQTALTMDFKPKDKTEGELSLQVDKPGTYLLRLETKGAAVGPDDHEHFATLDVIAR